MERLNTILSNNPDLVQMDSVRNIMIDLGKTNKYNKKTILHMLIEDEEEEQLLTILTQYLEQKQFDEKEEAVTQGNQNRIKFANLDVNAQDINGWTPLITVIISKTNSVTKVCKLLLDLGADPFIASRDGKNAFHWATRIGNLEVLKTLMSGYTDEQVDEMLECKTGDFYHMKPIHLAVRFDHIEVFKYLTTIGSPHGNYKDSR